MKNNKLIIGDTEYDMDADYRQGALAVRRSVPWTCNPFNDKSQRADQWNYGHENESEGFHITLNGVDAITVPRNGETLTSANC